MTTTTLPARIPNGQPAGRAVRVRATIAGDAPRPRLLAALDPDTSLPFAIRKGRRLLTNGYRFARCDDQSYTCTGPDGQTYLVNLVTDQCSCAATATCSHLIAARRIAKASALHPCRPEAEWFDHECVDCGAPSWSYVQSGSYGRSWRVAVCPCGCETRTMGEAA
jgi:hypothetical protein